MRTGRTIMVMVCATAFSSCLGVGGFRPSSPDPAIWVDSDRYDWGAIPATDTVDHIFLVRNTGAQPLSIARVQTSCGCTAAVLDKQMLKPGEDTRLKVTFDPRGRPGPQTRTVWIHSNDPKAPQRQLVIQATVETPPPQAPVQAPPAASATVMTVMAVPAAGSATVSAAPAPVAPAAVQPAPAAAKP